MDMKAMFAKQVAKSQGVKEEPEKKANPLMALHKSQQAEAEVESEKKEAATPEAIAEAEGPMDFQSRLDEVDRLISLDHKIGVMTVDAVRAHVKVIMIELKENPELESCLIDRDVHNVLAFIRTVKDNAVVERVVSKEKSEKRAKAKASKGSAAFNFFDSNLLPAGLAELGKKEV